MTQSLDKRVQAPEQTITPKQSSMNSHTEIGPDGKDISVMEGVQGAVFRFQGAVPRLVQNQEEE